MWFSRARAAVDGVKPTDISYYIDNFSIMDQNIIAYIKDILFELEELNIIMIIKMMPELFNHSII